MALHVGDQAGKRDGYPAEEGWGGVTMGLERVKMAFQLLQHLDNMRRPAPIGGTVDGCVGTSGDGQVEEDAYAVKTRQACLLLLNQYVCGGLAG